MVERGTNAPSPALSSNSFSSSVTACCPSIFSFFSLARKRRVFYTHQSEIIFPPRNLINPIIGFFRSWLLRTVQQFPRLGSNQITTSPLLLQSQQPVCKSYVFSFSFFFFFVHFILYVPNHRVFPFLYIFPEQITFAHAALVAFSSHSRVIINTLYTQASNHIAGSLCILLSSP